MKRIFSLLICLFSVLEAYSYCGWDFNTINYYGTNEVVDYPTNVNAIYTNMGCELTYGAVTYSRHARIVNDGGVQASPTDIYNPSSPVYSIQGSIVHSSDVLNLINQQSFDINELCELMYNNPMYTSPGGILTLNGGVYFDIIMVYKYSWYNVQTGAQQIRCFKIRHRIYHGYRIKMNNISVICSSKGYLFNDLFQNIPLEYSSPELTSNTSFTYNQVDNKFYFNQPSGNSFELVMTVYFGSYLVQRKFLVAIEELKEAYFVSTIQSSGPVTINSSSVNMNNYSSYNGGIREYSGSGIVVNGPNYFFDPNIANQGNNLVMVRTNNNGCLSDWRDTNFYVTPITSVLNAPNIDLEYTFGSGEIGTQLFSNIYGQIAYEGDYHAGCSNTDYSFKVKNPQAGLTYEWKTIYNSSLFNSGTGITFDVTTPDRSGVEVNLSSSTYPADTLMTHLWNPSYPYHGILGADCDLDNNQATGSFLTAQIGKRFEVFVKGINVNGDESPWKKVVIGLSPRPLLKTNEPLCFNGNPILVPLTDTPVYNDSVGYNEIRSTIWDVNMNGIFEWDGSVDSVVHNLINTVKYQPMRTQIIDSMKYFGYSNELVSHVNYYIPTVSTVCKSDIDTVFVVRNPNIIVNLSNPGISNVGTIVTGVVGGSFFSPDNDSIAWNWNDGSPTYYGDSIYHFLNDLQYYSLNVSVTDSFGCNVDSTFIDYWFVDGILSIEESAFNDSDLVLYPVPVTDILNIESEFPIENVVIVNALGNSVYESRSEISKNIDCSDFAPGQYIVMININGVIINRKIIKK